MSYLIVVARYNESIDWLLPQLDRCIICNKGIPLTIKNQVILPNLGREAETYLHFIIANYHRLPDVVVFTQARIADHKGANDVQYLLKLKDDALLYSKSRNFFTHQDDSCIHFGRNWNLRHDGFFLKDNYKNRPVLFHDWFKKYIKPDYPFPINIYGNAIFAVRKDLILKHPIHYYTTLIKEVNHHINSTEGHFFERSWYYIFD